MISSFAYGTVVCCLSFLVVLYSALWRLFLSPISKFPGPKLAAVTFWYEFYYDVLKDGGGQFIWEIERMHRAYGPIVRINPCELHVIDPQFYDEIYANNHRRRNKYGWQIKSGNSPQAMGFTIDHDLHRLRRETLDSYFSKRNVLRLEGVIEGKTAKMCQRIKSYHGAATEGCNLTNIFLATTMDIITDYAFADCYNLLDSDQASEAWKNTITNIMKGTTLINHFGWLPRLVELSPQWITQLIMPDNAMIEYKSRITLQIKRLLRNKTMHPKPAHKRKVIFDELLSSEELPTQEKRLERLTDEGAILLIAASETPAKVLSIILFHLMSQPQSMERLRTELQEVQCISMKAPSLSQLEQLPYMTAVIKEGLRMHNGIVARSQRVAPTEILRYKDWIIPPGTPVSSISYFVHHNTHLFPEPKSFRPERWLNLEGRRLDKYLVAFGRGTRNCVGTNLGMAELYMMLATVIKSFDLDLFETDIRDVEVQRDWYVGHPKVGSKGVRARVAGVRTASKN